MKAAFIVILMGMFTLAPSEAQVITLEDAYRAARKHYPRRGELGLIEKASAHRAAALEAENLPTLGLSGQGVYHSTVASIPLTLPGAAIPEVPHLQYRAGLGVEQKVFDGGLMDARLLLEETSAKLQQQEVSVAAYGLRLAVEDAFFGALSAARQREALEVLAGDIEARLVQLEAALSEGAARAGDLAALRAERLRVAQQEAAATARREGALDVLSLLTGEELGTLVQLGLEEPDADGQARPEEELIAMRAELARRKAEVARRANRPKVQAFAELAAGRPPGMDLFATSLEPFASAGLRVSWRLLDWGSTRRQVEALAAEADRAAHQRDAFRQEVDAQVVRLDREIAHLEAAITVDREIISLREEVAHDVGVRLQEGVATATEYLMERNAAHRARIEAEERRIRLAHLRARRTTVRGAQ